MVMKFGYVFSMVGFFGCCLFLWHIPHINSENTTSAVMMEMSTVSSMEEPESSMPDMFSEVGSGMNSTEDTSSLASTTSTIINTQSPIATTPTVLSTTATPPVTPSTTSVLSTISSPTSFTVTASTTIHQSTISSTTSDISADTLSSSDIYTVSTTSEMLFTTNPAGRPLVGIVLGCVIPAVVILLALAVFIACCCHYWRKVPAKKESIHEDHYTEVSLPAVSDIQETIDTDICPAYSTSTFIKNYSSDYVDTVVYDEVQ